MPLSYPQTGTFWTLSLDALRSLEATPVGLCGTARFWPLIYGCKMADEAAQLSRLRERQQMAIQETQEKIQQLNTFRKDYEALKTRLETLPDKLTHDVMVPIGKKAFMPGKLVHTNEILVLLGDNWFAEQSAKQSAAIVDRRIAVLDKQISDLKQQEGLLKPRVDFTSELEDMAQEKSDMFEIKEEYDPEQEKKWRAEHQKRVKEHKANLRKAREKQQQADIPSETTVLQNTGPSDEELWAKLDQLEMQEALGREMERRLSDEEGETTTTKKQAGSRTVRWEDEEDEENSEKSSDEDEYSGSDAEEEHEMRHKSVLHFKHSTSSVGETSQSQVDPAAGGDTPIITSPSDIYKYFLTSEPTSILKKPATPTSENVDSQLLSGHHPHPAVSSLNQPTAPSNTLEQESVKAFRDSVVERNPVQQVSDPNDSKSEHPTKRISKFKAQRMQQKR